MQQAHSLSVERLSVISPVGHILLSPTTFTIQTGEVLYITGRNGVGKSTLLAAIADYAVDVAGKVTLNNQLKEAYTEKDWQSLVCRLGQHNRLQFPIKVSDLLMMAYYRQRSSTGYTYAQIGEAKQMAESFQIGHLWDRMAHQLSGGELQLCWLAQIALQKPAVMLLDEPTQYLDAQNRHAFFSLIHQYVKSNPVMVVCVTHDLLFNTEEGIKTIEVI
jgi:ABC-type cobalamin/Fe3+-siderophores transport system ATPase subunit